MRVYPKRFDVRLGSTFPIRQLAVGLIVLAACAVPVHGQVTYDATVRRTEGGIPHIVANTYASLGYGTGYAMAQDNICLLADQFLTYAAERSRFLGAGANNANLNSDFFYKLYIDRGEAWEPVDERQAEVFRGAAAGYNRYLRDTGVNNLPDPSCRGAAWVREIGEIDFRRISRMNFFYPFLLAQIVGAAPPAAGAAASGAETALGVAREDKLASVVALLESVRDKGSNGLGLGRDATVNGTGMLLTNPHLNWTGTLRFWAFHQTIPGELDIAGANVMGRPQVGFGTTRDIAFTNTVTTSPLNTFYRLNLVSGNPTKYLFDGAQRDMLTETVTVQMADGNGGLQSRSHTFYSTHFGALLLGGFPWTTSNAYAVRATDAGWRSLDALLPEYQAKTVHELKAVHDQWQFWTGNLMAADSSGETLYADPIPCPNLTSAQVAACTVPFPVPVLDGSRSDCMWKNDPDAVIPGILGPSKLPYLYRTDYVDNSNDSPWLSNPNQPLTYDAPYLGSIGTERTLRTRSALSMIQKRLDGTDGQGAPNKFTLEQLQGLMMSDQAYTAQILGDGLVTLCQNNPVVPVSNPTEDVDISAACPVLAAWDRHDNLDSKGAHLFREFMRAAIGASRTLGNTFNYDVPFDVNDPVNTPRGLNATNNPNALQALASAVRTLRNAGIALDAQLGDLQYVTRNDARIPIHGGIEPSGLFNIINAPFVAAAGGYPDVTSGSSWIMATEFASGGPAIRAVLTYSQSTNPDSPHYDDMTKLFSEKKWVNFPFNQADVIAAATETAHLTETVAFTPTPTVTPTATPTATRTATPTTTGTATPVPTSGDDDDGGCTVSAPAPGNRSGGAWWLLIPVAVLLRERGRRWQRRAR
ncbi:MAG: penicillin acylase family protein [Candidatus Binatia bacterium]